MTATNKPKFGSIKVDNKSEEICETKSKKYLGTMYKHMSYITKTIRRLSHIHQLKRYHKIKLHNENIIGMKSIHFDNVYDLIHKLNNFQTTKT